MMDKILRFSKEKIKDRIGKMDPGTLVEIDRALALWMGDRAGVEFSCSEVTFGEENRLNQVPGKPQEAIPLPGETLRQIRIKGNQVHSSGGALWHRTDSPCRDSMMSF